MSSLSRPVVFCSYYWLFDAPKLFCHCIGLRGLFTVMSSWQTDNCIKKCVKYVVRECMQGFIQPPHRGKYSPVKKFYSP